MKKLLITGCSGQLGRALNKEYEGEQVELINTDVPELDITDLDPGVQAGCNYELCCHDGSGLVRK